MKMPYEVGEVFKNPEYAKLMEKIIAEGRDGFYKGEVAKAIVDTVNKYGGLFTMEDMANYEVEVLSPSRAPTGAMRSSPPPLPAAPSSCRF